jgi:hypothetical protein
MCQTNDSNARRRVRTSGIVKKNYYTSTRQYLESRSRSYQQNQYNYNLERNALGKPGDPRTINNIYAPLVNYFDVSGCTRNIYYKPNNFQFAQQGAVTASSLVARIKYNTMTSNTMKYRTVYGDAVANAMAYGIADEVYTVKSKIGYNHSATCCK